MQVNRSLTDKTMDRIDHALGRPVNPLAETYRNHFATGLDSELATEMAMSAHWHMGCRMERTVFFHVTEHGRFALRDHLREIRDPHRAFEITVEEHTSTVIAKTASAAKYHHWLGLSDICPDLTFGAYLRLARVRRAL